MEIRRTSSVESALDILKSGFDECGKLDCSKLQYSKISSKMELRFKDLSCVNSGDFCRDAAVVIAHNILLSIQCHTPSLDKYPLKKYVDSFSEISDVGNFESAMAMALLVHTSKFQTRRQFLTFLNLVYRFSTSKVQIVEPPLSLEEATALLHRDPLRAVLLQDAENLAQDLCSIKTVFIDLKDQYVRAWSAPSLVVVNVAALVYTLHLEHPIPLAALIGHSMCRVLAARRCGDDLNFPACPPTDEVDSVLGPVDRVHQPGLWFEVTALGAKLAFEPVPGCDTTGEVIRALEEGISAGRIPAANAVKLVRLPGSWAPRNTGLLFDYDTSEYTE